MLGAVTAPGSSPLNLTPAGQVMRLRIHAESCGFLKSAFAQNTDCRPPPSQESRNGMHQEPDERNRRNRQTRNVRF